MKHVLGLFLLLYIDSTFAFSPSKFKPNVVDEANVLSETELQAINENIQKLRQQSNVFAAVYIVKTLGVTPIEEAAYETFKSWKLGSFEKNNGLLFLFAIDDRNARIEVGSGLEGDITDLHSKRLLDLVILPYFKKTEYGPGILDGLNTVSLIINKLPLPENWEQSPSSVSDLNYTPSVSDLNTKRGFYIYSWWLIILFVISPILLLLSHFAPKPNGGTKIKFVNNQAMLLISKKKPIESSYYTPILLSVFLSINPGIFIFIFSALDDIYENISNSIKPFLESGVLFSVAISLFVFPIIIKNFSTFLGRLNKNINPNCYRPFPSNLIFLLNLNTPSITFSIALILVLVFACMILKSTQPIPAFSILFLVALTYFLTIWNMAKLLFSPKAYRRSLAKIRWSRMCGRSYGQREIFGKNYVFTRPSSSTSGSSSSSGGYSSSSGGGRSSGGGASSRW